MIYSPEIENAVLDLEDYEEEEREVEKILRWRRYHRGSTRTKEYLVLFKNEPLENATWILENYFSDEFVDDLH